MPWVTLGPVLNSQRLNHIWPQTANVYGVTPFVYRIMQGKGAFFVATHCGVYIQSSYTGTIL